MNPTKLLEQIENELKNYKQLLSVAENEPPEDIKNSVVLMEMWKIMLSQDYHWFDLGELDEESVFSTPMVGTHKTINIPYYNTLFSYKLTSQEFKNKSHLTKNKELDYALASTTVYCYTTQIPLPEDRVIEDDERIPSYRTLILFYSNLTKQILYISQFGSHAVKNPKQGTFEDLLTEHSYLPEGKTEFKEKELKEGKRVFDIYDYFWGNVFVDLLDLAEGKTELEASPVYERMQQNSTEAYLHINSTRAIAWALRILECNNTYVYTDKVAKALQKKRNKNGSLPLQDRKIICIEGASEETPVPIFKLDLPGTRYNPKTHHRRGHVRHLQSGKVTWVRDTIVNKDKESSDIITKSTYRVRD